MQTNPDHWDDLISEWDEIREGYHLGDTHRTVLECARQLEESVAADSPDTALWVLGLVLIGPYVIHARRDAAAEARVLKAMGTVERALGQPDCAHEEHPCDDMADGGELDDLQQVLEMLAHPQEEDRMAREIWTCPSNLTGIARAFADA
ncbi:hypothetical protein [Streptomyces lanatus]|uniref:Uncharacterized protein n=1 Tax=Streptomyces lanatus TaxID=66900 RepID=A0ABV1Y6Z2_9ACTN|nr:hypothetical protein [Streptomyces lanatus]